jgi:hypothetical protein
VRESSAWLFTGTSPNGPVVPWAASWRRTQR